VKPQGIYKFTTYYAEKQLYMTTLYATRVRKAMLEVDFMKSGADRQTDIQTAMIFITSLIYTEYHTSLDITDQ